jgi:hypothetical protein
MHPKQSALAQINNQDFASLLEARIRGQSVKLIASNVDQPPANLQSPPAVAVADKRFRRA